MDRARRIGEGVLFVLAAGFFLGFPEHFALFAALLGWSTGFAGKFVVEGFGTFEAGILAGTCDPLAEEGFAFFANVRVGDGIYGCDAQTFEQWSVGKDCALKPGTACE